MSTLSDNQLKFIYANNDLPLRESGVTIYPRELSDGSLSIMMELRWDTTHDDVRRAATLALDWRNRLLEWQGSGYSRHDIIVLNEIDQMQKKDLSYAQIARLMNNRIAQLLLEYVKFIRTCEKHAGQFKTIEDYYQWIFGDWLRDDREDRFKLWMSLREAETLMRDLRMTEEDIKSWIHDGLYRLSKSETPFIEGTPINRWKIMNVIRFWRRNMAYIALHYHRTMDAEISLPPSMRQLSPYIHYRWGRQKELTGDMHNPWSEELLWKPLDMPI